MNNGYLIPANSKKGTLILNIFRRGDALMFGTGILVSLLLLMFFNTSNVFIVILSCMPAAITGLLVLPIPNYHNVLVVLQCIFEFYTERQKFEWKGWCFYERIANEGKNTKK